MGGSQSAPKPPPPRQPSPPPSFTQLYGQYQHSNSHQQSPSSSYTSVYAQSSSQTSTVSRPRTSQSSISIHNPITLSGVSTHSTVSRPSASQLSNSVHKLTLSASSTSSGSSLLPGADIVAAPIAKVGSSGADVASPATVVVTHDVSDYVVEKVDPTQCMLPNIDYVPRNVRCDRHILRVCQIYQQRRYVCQKFCHRFHVCLSWINGQCNSSPCNLDHGFHSPHNQVLTRHLVDHRFSEDQLAEQLKKNVEFGRKARSKFETKGIICPHNVVGRCKHQNCRNLHLKERYSWEVQDGNWVRFPKYLNEFLENSLSDAEKDVITLELKNNSDSQSRDIQHLQKIFGTNCSSAEVDLRNCTLQSQNRKIYQMRRLSTPSDVFANVGANTRWLWYVTDPNGRPQFLTHGETDKFYQLALSDCLERALQNGESQVNCRSGAFYDLVNHTFNQHGSVARLLRRPAKLVPADAKDEKPVHFRDLWTDNLSNGIFSVTDLSVGSNEYMFVENMFRATLHNIGIQKIFRIQNRFLWDAYQLKKRQMLQIHKGNTKLLKEQYMFHGTKASVLEKIYEGNLDWRLYGTNVGCVFGRGTYFSNQASVSDGYTSGTPKVILLAMVLVGDACKGNRSMDYPPKNPKTNLHYDTTVNTSSHPTIYVKYNDDEYYPAYAVYYV